MIYTVGGLDVYDRFLNSIESINAKAIVNNSLKVYIVGWKLIQPPPDIFPCRSRALVCQISDNHIVIFGGFGGEGKRDDGFLFDTMAANDDSDVTPEPIKLIKKKFQFNAFSNQS